jgi:thioredoxin-related protein
MRATLYAFLPANAVPMSEVNHLRYGVSTTPTLVLLDRVGTVRLYHPGAMSAAELEPLVSGLLSGAAKSGH